MKPSDQLQYLLKEIDDLVARYKDESSYYKKVAFRLKLISVLLAALITILLGIKLTNTEYAASINNISLILSASITVIGASEAFFDPRSLWVRETVTFVRLKDLQRDVLFWSAGKEENDLDVNKLDSFKSRLDRILDDTLKYWMKIRGAPDLEKSLEAKAELKAKENN